MPDQTTDIQQLAINTIRTLSMDGVQKANSGHPGTPMALAPVAYAIWNEAMQYDPAHPCWPARDRFVLSCGHASMLLYSMLHLTQVQQTDEAGQATGKLAIGLEDLKNFRQLHSPCAGHPEYGEAAGIETTTGPLGQGVGNSVGMAIAAQWLAARYDRPGYDLFGYHVYALCSDGDMMEGVACEAASLAGHLKLANLCWIYDDNHITIEGDTDLAFSEDVARRFEGLGWKTIKVDDANDVPALSAALKEFRETEDRPTLIIVRSIIGFGSPNKANTHGAHGCARWARTKSGSPKPLTAGRKTSSSWSHRKWSSILPKASGSAAKRLTTNGRRHLRSIQRNSRERLQSSRRSGVEDCRTDGSKGFPFSRPMRKDWRTRVTSGKVLNAIGSARALADWWFGRSCSIQYDPLGR